VKVLIVAKARQGDGTCVGGITFRGVSVRLLPWEPEDEHDAQVYQVGDVWEIRGERPATLRLPHTEDARVRTRERVGQMADPVSFIEEHMPPCSGGPNALFGGLLQRRAGGALCIEREAGVPRFSTQFWRPDRPLTLKLAEGDLPRYVFGGDDADGSAGSSLALVGFQEPVTEIPAGALVRVSLAHWWRPVDRPDEVQRCYAQLSGWFPEPARRAISLPPAPAGNGTNHPLPSAGAAGAARASDIEAAREVMREVFGFHDFRALQQPVIENVLAGRPTLAVMPTGAGKSACYQVPALLLDGLSVVVSPLISLMQDQVDQLRQFGVAAVFLNSSLTYAEYRRTAQQVRRGEVRLLYVAPETLLRAEVRELLAESRVAAVTIDEAHCISEWGHDFRPAYRQIQQVLSGLRHAAPLALTATATRRVQDDVRRLLGITERDTFVAGFDRPNLFLDVRRRGSGFDDVIDFLKDREEQSGIVYCSTQAQVNELAAHLNAHGIPALPYHAGMENTIREQNQRRFSRDDARLIIATIAFGMGINKPDIRFVLHYALPQCIEAFYQQIGRAGRDGLRAECRLLFARADVGVQFHLIESGAEQERAGRMARLQAMVRYAESSRCRRLPLLQYFDEPGPSAPCGMCDNCLAEQSGRKQVDVTAEARLFLAAVRDTGQRFGAMHVIQVLRGSQGKPVLTRRHDRLPSFGLGKETSAERWRSLADRFIEQDLLVQEMEYGTLRLSSAGLNVLGGGGTVCVPEEQDAVLSAARAEPAEYDVALFDRLRRQRRTLAEAAGVAPFMVFSDRSLQEMAALRPTTREALLEVHGVGQHKADRYADAFLSEIREYVGAMGERTPLLTQRVEASPTSTRSEGIAAEYRAGATVAAIAKARGVQPETILGHLERAAAAGAELDPDRLESESTLDAVLKRRVAATEVAQPGIRLGDLYRALNGEVPYFDLRLLRLVDRLRKRYGSSTETG
jgi:ATP-dependent DNA helicase RecQ